MDRQHGAEAVGTVGTGDEDRHTVDDGGEHGKAMVTITVDTKPILIHRGHQPVSEIKRLGGVPSADELEQVIEGEPLKPLADDGSVVIKGGEEFISHPKDSGSSFAELVE